MALIKDSKLDVQPMADYGFFGPGSVTWKVWSSSTAGVTGLQRAVVVEELDPNLIAAVDKTGANYDRPRTRYDRTVRYFAMVAFADSATVCKAADVLVKVHSKAIGIEPVSRNRYDANDPDSQLWILLTGWHSVLKAYEMYGGKLSPEEENQFWAECAIAAEFQTVDPADVPRTSQGVRDYFERMRPRLAVSEATRNMMDHLLNAKAALPPAPLVLRPFVWALNTVLRAGTIATMPRWMRRLSNFDQPRIVDILVRPILKLGYRITNASPRRYLAVARLIAPSVVPIIAPVVLGIPPISDEILTPAEARRRYGYAKPAEAHLELRAEQRDRVFNEGQRPSEDGLIESQPILGSLT